MYMILSQFHFICISSHFRLHPHFSSPSNKKKGSIKKPIFFCVSFVRVDFQFVFELESDWGDPISLLPNKRRREVFSVSITN